MDLLRYHQKIHNKFNHYHKIKNKIFYFNHNKLSCQIINLTL